MLLTAYHLSAFNMNDHDHMGEQPVLLAFCLQVLIQA